MSRHSKAILWGIIIGVLGLAGSMLNYIDECDQRIGLDFLFGMRGPIQPPPDAVIVAIDKASAQHLNLPRDPVRWPRSLHGRLIDILSQEGAGVISFDLLFDEYRDPIDDNRLAQSIQRAGNVILCGAIMSEYVRLRSGGHKAEGSVMIETFVPPIPLLAAPTLATASFPLPRVPVRVDQCWSFKLGSVPTLPVVMLQAYSLDVYDEFISGLAHIDPLQIEALPRNTASLLTYGKLQNSVRSIRDLFENDPPLANKALEGLDHPQAFKTDVKKTKKLQAIIRMYAGEESQFINYYGPPGTITRIPYFKVIEGGSGFDFKGKAVFVGVTEDLRAEQMGGFYTVFSQKGGENLSSVELAATVFSNLLERRSIDGISPAAQAVLLFMWGLVIGFLCRQLPGYRTALIVISLCLVYAGVAYHQFKTSNLWLPLFVPVLIQAPVAILAASAWHYSTIRRERENVRKAIGYYLPDHVIDSMVQNISDFKTKSDMVHGTVLYADAEKYSTLAETMSPSELKQFMNRYYEIVFGPVKKHEGRVLDVVGDAMLAIWYGERLGADVRVNPCRAALEIAAAVASFNENALNSRLPIRIGLHAGHVSLGSVGAHDHYEYRAVGDCVNTASRLEGLNKYLKTRILVSDDVIAGIGEFLTRPLGKFILAGKVNAVTVHELICRREEADEAMIALCENFSQALEAYRGQIWNVAIDLFENILAVRADDGPSAFYLQLCREFILKPPPEGWDGSVALGAK
ncbi:MAG TPA: adenylate/guanylate cyclase domain-containing protein [Syntrophales bacterium]|nr:adenylate/guanylate cyclase domain-containing protein [Syntrophales bacterium]HOX93520.1 adenylate/guanylate cyclase domain-containing protein [Syntrophales bacterium]HPI56011.1 adenylate/guanylate cyclase domain-containing protein [Syntrophales bacterium]HPN24099.1 adenylate/guanylate cyclase domain-containing protein [Syntrophales bacterium]HQM28378.1 adenylate/guanylate cyclase domain-containing protein [Syntrophales bacterium]